MKWYFCYYNKNFKCWCSVKYDTIAEAVVARESWVMHQIKTQFEPTLKAMRKRYSLPINEFEEVQEVLENIRVNSLKISTIVPEDEYLKQDVKRLPVPEAFVRFLKD